MVGCIEWMMHECTGKTMQWWTYKWVTDKRGDDQMQEWANNQMDECMNALIDSWINTQALFVLLS